MEEDINLFLDENRNKNPILIVMGDMNKIPAEI